MVTRPVTRISMVFVVLAVAALPVSAQRRVTSDRPTLPPGRWSIDASPFLSIGSLDSGGPDQFGQISDVLVLPDGSVVVSDGQARDFRIFDSEGNHVRSLGGPGEGPEEFGGNPWLAASGDSLVTWDPGNYRVSWWSPEGNLARQNLLISEFAESGAARFVRGRVWEVAADGSVLSTGPYGFPRGEGLQRSTRRLVRIGPGAGEVVQLGIYPTGQVFGFTSGGRNGSVNHPFAYQMLIAHDRHSGRVAVAGDSERAVAFLGPTGDTVLVAEVGVPREPLTRSLVRGARGALREQAERSSMPLGPFESAFDDLPMPDSLPAIRELHWDDEENIWAGRWRGLDLGSLEFDVLSSDGAWLTTVTIPDGLGRIEHIGTDFIATMWTDDFDVSYVRLHRLNKHTP